MVHLNEWTQAEKDKACNLYPELVEALEAYHCPMCAASIECQDDYCYRVRAVLAKAKASSVPDTYSPKWDSPTT